MADEKGVGLKGWLSGPRPKTPIDPVNVEKLVPLNKHRIAVLPMTNISPDPQDDYFAEGMTDELISTISRIQGLRVVARTSSMRYKGSGKGVSEISQELRTGSVLEGTVRKAGNRLRVTAQLVDPESEENLWSQTYDRKLGDVFNIQSDIARNVAEGLKVQLHASHGTRFQNEPTKNTEAYSIYLKGRYFWNRGTADSLKKALVQFELAVKKDPNFALGYSGLADTYLLLGRIGTDLPKLLYPKAIEIAAKAIAIDASIAEPHATLAAARQEYEWKWEEAEREFKQARELNPSYAWAHSGYGLFLGHVGRYDEAIESTKRAQELDPFSPRIHTNASEEYLFAHQYDLAIEAAERAIEIDSSFPAGYGWRGDAEVEKGMYEQAIADFREADKLVGFPVLLGNIGYVLAISGRTSEASGILEQLKNDRDQRPTDPPDRRWLRIALVHIGLGNNQLALDLLEKVFDEHSPAMTHLKSWPAFSRLHGEPRYRALLKKVGLDR
ncbi:MAG TPA: tetratricopeptide repeat protein [Candidatus Bathyarchaeia archaeon]|nr:tetratricopeptide repeat protein [Candidatus Bathyarchaeia archaeon]